MTKITKESFYGVSNLPLTPLNPDYSINVKAVEQEIDWLVERGAVALWFRGFLGECAQLTMEDSKVLIKAYADYGKGRTLLGAGCHAQKTFECIELANYADKLGCDFAWITPPLYPSSGNIDTIKNHYKMIVENTSIPLAIYSSGGTGVYCPPQLINEIIDMAPDRFVALKDSQGILTHFTELFRLGIPDKVAFLPVGGDHLYCLYLGTKATICTPEQMVLGKALFDSYMAGDKEKAIFYQHRILGGYPLLAYFGNAVSLANVFKQPLYMYAQKEAASKILGIDFGPYALPTVAASPALRERVLQYVDWWKPLDLDAPLPDHEFGYTF